jgi:hypothetical protein
VAECRVGHGLDPAQLKVLSVRHASP